jgi:serine/threonine protein kinase
LEHTLSGTLEFSRGDVIAKKYEVVDLLDESPLGPTYRAKHMNTGQYVRITMLRPTIAGRDHKEQIISAFKLAKDTQHPNLLKVGELGENEGIAYYTAEDFDGRTLREIIQESRVEGRKFELKEAAQITMQILEALDAAHSREFIFRSIRPEHVLVNVRYAGPRRQNFVAQVKVVGLGFWSLVDTATLAEDEFSRGEAQYLAPELKSFEPIPTACSDIYSAGVCFYEMLVGTAPVGTFQLPKQRRPDLPEHVNDVVELALAQAPEDRYQTCRDFITDIQRTFQDASIGPQKTKPLITPLGWILLLVLVALVATIFYFLREDPAVTQQTNDFVTRRTIADAHAMPSTDEIRAIRASEPVNMIYIPPGPYLHGRLNQETDDSYRSEAIAETKVLPAYMIDAFEHPNYQDGNPATKVTWSTAQAACKDQGKRLCSEEEWEKACKGPKNFVYSYGDEFQGDAKACGNGLDDIYLSGTKKNCRSGWQVFDMSGNFAEWTGTQAKEGRYIVKGGMLNDARRGTRCAFTTDERSNYINPTLSFRCCKDVGTPWPGGPTDGAEDDGAEDDGTEEGGGEDATPDEGGE